MCEVSVGSRDNSKSLSSPVTAQRSVDSSRTESNISQQISHSIDQLLNEVRRERAERADTGRNFQQMFNMLRMEIRELRQRDNEQERERERERQVWALERERLMWDRAVQHQRQEGVGAGMHEQPRTGHTQVEFQTTSPELRGSRMQQYGRCRDNQSQQQSVFSLTPFHANLTPLCSSSNLHDSSHFTNNLSQRRSLGQRRDAGIPHNHCRREEHTKKSERYDSRKQEGKRRHNDMKECTDKNQGCKSHKLTVTPSPAVGHHEVILHAV